MTEKAVIDRLAVSPTEVPTQIRIGEEPVAEKFDAPTDFGHPMPSWGLFTTSLRRHGPLWHLHMPKDTDSRSWWRVVPRSDARIARIERLADVDALAGDTSPPSNIPWDVLAETVDGVWLTEPAHERLTAAVYETDGSWRTQTHDQRQRYSDFGMWASNCVLWLRWCFETIELYRHGRPEPLYISPFTRAR